MCNLMDSLVIQEEQPDNEDVHVQPISAKYELVGMAEDELEDNVY